MSKLFNSILSTTRMRSLLVFLIVTCGTSSGLAQLAPLRDAADCSDAFFTALLNEDSKSISKLVSPDFGMVSFDGQLIDARILIDGLERGQLLIETGTIMGKYTRNYNDTGVVTGKWQVRGQIQGYTYNNTLAFTTVCVRQGGSWKVVSVQFTPTP